MISVPAPKNEKCADTASEFASRGAIPHKDLENLIGEISFTQTSGFGRFGGTLFRPVRDMLKLRPYLARLSRDEIGILRWRVALLRDDISRICFPKSPRPEAMIYTDSGTATKIVDSLVIDVEDFGGRRGFCTLRAEISDPKWEETFILTTCIYGLEMLSILAT